MSIPRKAEGSLKFRQHILRDLKRKSIIKKLTMKFTVNFNDGFYNM